MVTNGWFWTAVVGLTALIVGACAPSGPPLSTVAPTSRPSPTALPTDRPAPTPTSTPQPTLPVTAFSLALSLESDQAPADGRSRVAVLARLTAPEEVNTEGLTVYFLAEGGGEIDPPQVSISAGEARTEYVAGLSGIVRDVHIEAVVDVPNAGRVIDDETLQLVGQPIALSADCPFVGANDSQPHPLRFSVTSNVGDVNGDFLVRAFLPSDEGTLWLDASGQVPNTGPVITDNLTATFYYVAPLDRASGSTAICADLPERPDAPGVCSLITWGSPVAQLETRVDDAVFRALRMVPDFRARSLDSRGLQVNTLASLRYDVVLDSGFANADQPYLMMPIVETPWEPATCIPFDLKSVGLAYIGFQTRQPAWVARWTLAVAGNDPSRPVVASGDMMMAPSRLSVDSDATIAIRNGASLTLMPERPDPDFFLGAVLPFDSTTGQTPVLLRFFVPATYVAHDDSEPLRLVFPESGVIEGVTTLEAYQRFQATNLRLSVHLPEWSDYLLSQEYFVGEDQWYAVLAYGNTMTAWLHEG